MKLDRATKHKIEILERAEKFYKDWFESEKRWIDERKVYIAHIEEENKWLRQVISDMTKKKSDSEK